MLVLAISSPRLLMQPTSSGDRSRNAVVVSEFMAAGQQVLADEDGDYPDWIELHNRGSHRVNLLGWSLTDDPAEPDKWRLPNVDLAPGGYLIVFASGKDRPSTQVGPKDPLPDPLTPTFYLHSGFKLQSEGGYLALYDNSSRRFLDASPFRYPQQFDSLAYGMCDKMGSPCYFATPTPGQANDESKVWKGLVAPITADVPRGFYAEPFRVTLSSETSDAVIWYTTDGSEPVEGKAQKYTEPVSIEGTTVLRAKATKPEYLAAPTATYSYIFPDQVLAQTDPPAGYPAQWGKTGDSLVGYKTGTPVTADYAMDAEVVEDPKYRGRLKDSLLSLPSLAIATGVENLDIYFTNPMTRGIESERPVSIEWLDPDDATADFQVDAGMRIQGHLGRSDLVPKHSLRLLFKKQYGPTELEYRLFPNSPVESFNTLVLRAGNNESFAGHPDTMTRLATYAKDEWLRRSQLALSGYGVRGRFVHLYLNGLYWGLYDLVERPDAAFAASYLGGDKEEWFTAKPGGADDGILCRIDSMRRLAELGGMIDTDRYAAMKKFIDPVQFSDYMVTHWYAGADDWPENNWTIAMREADSPFVFLAWDGELTWLNGAFVDLGAEEKQDRVFPNFVKSLFLALIQNPDFRMTLADRLYKHTSPGGILSDDEAKARWINLTTEIEEAIIAESARWGDAWFEDPITLDDWSQGRDQVLIQMDGNAARLLEQARTQGYYPPIDPPAFDRQSETFKDHMHLTMSATQGIVYYTLDGSDPRMSTTGSINPSAVTYDGPIELTSSTRVRARTLTAGVWSALNEADFSEESQPDGLRITELMYNPIGGDDYEFLELTNVSPFEIDLSGAAFEGIDLRFDWPTRLAGGATMVLVADAAAFRERHPDVPIAAVYGGELSDRGETMSLRSSNGEPLVSLAFDDENGWPLTPDGQGESLVLMNLAGNMDDPQSWGASPELYGTPGTGKSSVAVPTPGEAPDTNQTSFDVDAAQPTHSVEVRFGDDLQLAGYDLYRNGQPFSPEGLPIVEPGDSLDYVLYWRKDSLAGKEYRGFVQLATPDKQVLSQDDQPAGFVLTPLTNCPAPELIPDRYIVRITAEAKNGLLRPTVGGHVPGTSGRLPVYSDDGTRLDDDYGLPPLKVIGPDPAPSPQYELRTSFGEHIQLLGYDLDTPRTELQPGDPLTVTLFFQSQEPVDEDYIRFIHLHSPDGGMAAQSDSQPAFGANPTWSWKAGEIIVDMVRMTIAPDAAPDDYALLIGFYRPADGARLPVYDQAGAVAPDQALPLRQITIAPIPGVSANSGSGEGIGSQ